jgi:hypothetical protein
MKKTLTILTAAGVLALAAPALADDPAPTKTPSPGQQCKTERAQMGKEAFGLLYGTNANRRNAFGKCVSKRAQATAEAKRAAKSAKQAAKTVAAQVAADVNAAKTCKAERDADPAAFAEKYGTNHNKRNAFGKCVSGQKQADKGKSKDKPKDKPKA